MVAGHSGFASTVPQFRVLVGTEGEPLVRAGATVVLAQIGGAGDVALVSRLP